MAQTQHRVLPSQSHDEASRERFAFSMRRFLTTDMGLKVRRHYEDRLKPAFVVRNGRAPETVNEVRDMIGDNPSFRGHALLQRATQEYLWDVVGESVERQLQELIARAMPARGDIGSLRLDPSLAMPRYYTGVDIHVMPGNFHVELGPDDLYAGALYDRGVYLFAYGSAGPLNDAVGRAAANFVTEKFPALKPRRVLDLGCGVGHATLPFVDAYPEAELFGVDLGAPTLRYAHARAESLGAKVAFSQQNAASTDFEDGAFDLVVSCLLLHEVPQKVTSGIIAECHRLLAPGGVMMHADSFARRDEPFAAFLGHRHEVENHEPFITGGLTIDWEKACVDAGFARDDVFKVLHQPVHNRIPLHMRGAVKS